MKKLILRKQSKLNIGDHIHNFDNEDLLNDHDHDSTILSSVEESPIEQVDQDSMKDHLCGSDVTFHELLPSQIEDVCCDTLELFYDLELLHSDQDNKTTFDYIKQIFNTTEEKFTSFDEIARKNAATRERALTLKCKLIKANGLQAKSTNDPCCVLAVLDKKQYDSMIVHHNLLDWEEQEHISNIYRSSVKEKTVDPEWNETFELDITNAKDQYLVIELWNSDKTHKEKSKGFRGLLSDPKKNCFLGRVVFLLQHTLVGGGERIFDVLSHSGKHSRGTLTVWLDIARKKVKSEHKVHLYYKQLLQCIMETESKKDSQEYTRHWNAILPPIAEKLLTQHSSLHHITPLQQSALRLSVLLDYAKASAIDIVALLDVLQNIQHYEAEIPDSERSIKGTPVQNFTNGTSGSPSWVLTLIENLKGLVSHIINHVKHHLNMFDLKSDNDIKKLQKHLQVLYEVYQIRLFKVRQHPEDLNYKTLLTSTIQTAVPQSGNLMPPHSCIKENMVAFKALCSHCLKQCEQGYNKIHPVFMEVDVDYFSPFFTSLDKLLHSEVESRFEFEEDNPDIVLVTYEIYQIVQELVVFANNVNSEFLRKQKVDKLKIISYHLWFKRFVSKWIQLAQSKAKEKLLKAVELDTIVKCTDRASFSSSAVDAHAFFVQVISFWNNVKWPDREESIGYFVTVVQNLCELSTCYTELMFDKINPECYTDKDGHFIVTDKLCVILNNIHHVMKVLKNIETELDLPAYYKWLDEEKTVEGPKLSEHARTLILDVLDNADRDMFNKIDSIVKIIKKKVLSKDEFGVLHISHIYDSTKKALVVEVISAEHIPGLNRKGKSDPYVKLYLLPATIFTPVRRKTLRSAVQKQTLDPIFDETFELTADPSQLKQDGTILLLAIYNDEIFGRRFVGICVVPCNTTPLKGKERKIEHLNLFHYEHTLAFKELESRMTEPMAQKFMKTMKKLALKK